MIGFKKIQSILYKIYGSDRIHVYESKQSLNSYVSCNIKNVRRDILDIIICIKGDYAFIFNNMVRRKYNKNSSRFSISNVTWEYVFNSNILAKDFYRVIGEPGNQYYHKIILMRLDVLYESRYDLYELMEFSSDDSEIPFSYKKQIERDLKRKLITVTRKDRDAKFRKLVLEKYHYQCAICRCSEEELLQAAHIKAVSLQGDDNPDNGICLCANHHLMFDRGLISIDFLEDKIIVLRNSIKNMPWYSEFAIKYDGKIINTHNNKRQ